MPASTQFAAQTTAAEVLEGVDLTGRRAVVTGGASGIGAEIAHALSAAGAAVTLAVRDRESGERAAASLAATTGHLVSHAPLDLADQASVASFVATWRGPLHILVNNAAVMACPLARTAEGWELQFATNHIGHFALALGLRRALAEGRGRVVSVASSAHLRSPVVFDDVHFRQRRYDRWAAYGQSKTANVLFAVEASRRWAADGITVNAANPGPVRSGLQRHVTDEELTRARAQLGSTQTRWKTAEQGAATPVLLAASPLVEGTAGGYFEDCAPAAPHQPGTRRGVAPYALDPEAAARLWQLSLATLVP